MCLCWAVRTSSIGRAAPTRPRCAAQHSIPECMTAGACQVCCRQYVHTAHAHGAYTSAGVVLFVVVVSHMVGLSAEVAACWWHKSKFVDCPGFARGLVLSGVVWCCRRSDAVCERCFSVLSGVLSATIAWRVSCTVRIAFPVTRVSAVSPLQPCVASCHTPHNDIGAASMRRGTSPPPPARCPANTLRAALSCKHTAFW